MQDDIEHFLKTVFLQKYSDIKTQRIVLILNMHYVPFGKVLILWWVATNKCMYVNHIPQHNNLSPTSLLITLTVFVTGATNSSIYKHRPEVTFGPGPFARSNRL